MDLGIAGRRALVLGGNRGIGFGIAKALAAEGTDVAIAARDPERLAAAAAELRAASAARIETAAVDLAEIAELPALARRLSETFGPIDILVNNTGGPAYGGAAGRPIEEWRDRFQDMVLSVIALTDSLLPAMRARRWGRIL